MGIVFARPVGVLKPHYKSVCKLKPTHLGGKSGKGSNGSEQ